MEKKESLVFYYFSISGSKSNMKLQNASRTLYQRYIC